MGSYDNYDTTDTFIGTYDGQGHIIDNLQINRTTESYIGLFGYINNINAKIENLGVTNIDVNGYMYVGGFCGVNDGDIRSCSSIGSTSGNSYIGGFCGYISSGSINDCYSTGYVTADSIAGGFCGYNSSSISNSFSTGNITTDSIAGGFVGRNKGEITNSYTIGSISGSYTIGGFCGSNEAKISSCYSAGLSSGDYLIGGFCGANTFSIHDCYSTGNVTASIFAGGFCGFNKGEIYNIYSTGNVTGESSLGGLCGINFVGTISNSFWDIQTSGLDSSKGGIGKTTAEMKTMSTFTDVAWSFTAIWSINDKVNNGYPYFLRTGAATDVYVSDDYNAMTPDWNILYFNNLDTAKLEVSPKGIVHISKYNYTGIINICDKKLIVDSLDFNITGNITGGLVQTTNKGKLVMNDIAANTEKVFPITDGIHNFTVTITTADAGLPDIGIRILNQNVAGAISDKFFDISGPTNLNATIKFRIDKSLNTGTLNKRSFKYFDGTSYVGLNDNQITIEDKSDHYLVTVTGVNQF